MAQLRPGLRVLVTCAALLSISTSTARASDNEEDARALFEESISALRAGRFAEARELLSESLELFPTPSAAFNLAVALRGMGQSREALRVFESLVEGHYGELPDDRSARVRTLIEEVRGELGRLSVSVSGVAEARLRIDGSPAGVAREGEPAVRVVNAGDLSVAAVAEGYAPVEREVHVDRGDTVDVALPFVGNPTSTTAAESPAPSHRVRRWVLSVLAVLVVGAAVTAVVVTQRSELQRGDVFDGVTRTLVQF
ncbi:MAG: hypothetical protein AAGE52_03420 [Myxococcota bacterium]